MKRPEPRRLRRQRKGTLFVLGGLFLASALVRMGSEGGQALARVPEEPAHISPTPEPAALCRGNEDIALALGELQARQDSLGGAERNLEARRQALNAAERTIEERLTELVRAEEQLRATLAVADKAAEGDITRLTAVYEAMKPKEAALLFEEMDATFAAGFLGRMRPESAAGVLAAMTPQSAYSISVVIAGRNAAAPKQ